MLNKLIIECWWVTTSFNFWAWFGPLNHNITHPFKINLVFKVVKIAHNTKMIYISCAIRSLAFHRHNAPWCRFPVWFESAMILYLETKKFDAQQQTLSLVTVANSWIGTRTQPKLQHLWSSHSNEWGNSYNSKYHLQVSPLR
jgi:hypothetical protein